MAKLVDQLYSVMQGMEGRLGGGEGVQGIYGSITQQGMQRVLDCLHHSCGLGPSSTLVDIGAGLGRPLLHAQLQHQVAHAYGVESDPVKCSKAATFMRQSLTELVKRGGLELAPPRLPVITCALVEQIASLEPCTHAYSFWEGVPVSGKQAFGRLFAAARTMQGVAVVQRAFRGQDPALAMAELGFGPLQLIKTLPVKMSGSGRSFTAYVFLRPSPKAQQLLRAPGPLPEAPPHTPSKKEAAAAAAAAVDAAELVSVQGSAVKPARGRSTRQHGGDAAPVVRPAPGGSSPAAAAARGGRCSSCEGSAERPGGVHAAASEVSDGSCVLVGEGSSQEVVQQQGQQEQGQGAAGSTPTDGAAAAAAAAAGGEVAHAAAGAAGNPGPQGSAPPVGHTALAEGDCKPSAASSAGGTPAKGAAGLTTTSSQGAAAAVAVAGGGAGAAGEEGSCSGLVQLNLDDSWEANSPSKRLTLAGSLTSPGKRVCTLGVDESSRDSCDSSFSTYNLRPKRLPFSSRN